jgi:hypothetical protein
VIASYGGYSAFMLAGIHKNRFKTFNSYGILTSSMYGSTEELFFVDWIIGPYWDTKRTAQKSYKEFLQFSSNWNTRTDLPGC